MTQRGSTDTPFRIAIIGSGPSGFYAAEHLLKQKDVSIEVDMFDRLPTPYGLVRGGVAPDHQKIKSVTKLYERIASNPNMRFWGNVEFGTDITRADLIQYFHAIIYATGAETDRSLGIPGEDLPGSHAATAFVGWYNAHPDYRDEVFDLSHEKVAVIGVGNVAMDVARILARTTDELCETDMANHAIHALAQSKVKEIYVLGRRGPAQAAFTNPEIKELAEMADAEVIVAPEEVELDEYSVASMEENHDRTVTRNVEILTEYSKKPPQGKAHKIIMRFLVSPVEIIGTDRVEAIKLVKNELYLNEKGVLRPRATDQYETIPVGLVFRSVGYRGVPLPDVPFYDAWGIIPNENGRVLTEHGTGEVVKGDYVAGWIKRGPSGVIGTNKPDAVETVGLLVEDLCAGNALQPVQPIAEAIPKLLEERGIQYVTFADWQKLDQIEQERGEAEGRPRIKFSRVDAMIHAIQNGD